MKNYPRKIAIIAAISDNGVIGKDGGIPWRSKSDMNRFKTITLNHAIIMGRKTYESLPKKQRPLPDRRNVIISRQNYEASGCEVFSSLDEAFSALKDELVVFVIGGSTLFEEALKNASVAHITTIHTTIDRSDAVLFPDFTFSEDEWMVEFEELVSKGEREDHDSTYQLFRRRDKI